MQLLTLLFAITALFSVGNCSCEDPDDDQHSDICFKLLQSLQEALTQDKGNFYRSRKAFFYAPNADPVLLRVEYNITFENITEGVLPYCLTENNSSVLISLNQTKIIRGWTSRGLYLWIDPVLLNRAQLLLPFLILRRIHQLGFVKSNPEMDTFLWDGSYNLPTLIINLNITSLPCIPSKEVFNSTIEDLTILLRVYASQGSIKYDSIHIEDTAFALSEENISDTVPFRSVAEICFLFYTTIGAAVLIMTLLTSSWVKVLTKSEYAYDSLLSSTVVCGGILVISELLARIIVSVSRKEFNWHQYCIWFTTFMGYMLFFSMYIVYKKRKHTKFVTLHIVTYTILIYHHALPTFLLLLVYPAMTITIFAYFTTFIFVSIIFCSICLSIFKKLYVLEKSKKITIRVCGIITYISVFLMYGIFILLPLLLLLQLVYALALSQSSSITSSPIYTILSLLPSAVISFVTWVLKIKFFQFDTTELQELENEHTIENTNEQLEANNSTIVSEERIPLLKMEGNGDSDGTQNHDNGQVYGATAKNEFGDS